MRDACRFILETSGEAKGFLSDLQDYVRCEQGRMTLIEQQVDAAELVALALSQCEAVAERADVAFEVNVPEGVELRCDPHRLRGAIVNLCQWAARTAVKGSRLDVRLGRRPGDGMVIIVSGNLVMAAADEAFAPDLARLGFTGLALPIARRVALLHSGDVTIASGAGTGAAVRLHLPAGRVTWPAAPGNRAA